MKPATFTILARLVAERTGIVLRPEKQYLLKTRLRGVLAQHDLPSLDALAQSLVVDKHSALAADVIDAMTTNETSFFRDERPFEILASRVLPDIIEANRSTKRVRIWSAACSSGQEVYSIAMLLADTFPELDSWNVELLATDVSPTVVGRCEGAVYTRQETGRGLSEERIDKHFFQSGPNEFLLDPALKRRVSTRVHNLLEPLDGEDPFDLVVLRNVLIYFDSDVRLKVLDEIHRQLAPGGLLMLGTAETADPSLFERADKAFSGFFRALPRDGTPSRKSA